MLMNENKNKTKIDLFNMKSTEGFFVSKQKRRQIFAALNKKIKIKKKITKPRD